MTWTPQTFVVTTIGRVAIPKLADALVRTGANKFVKQLQKENYNSSIIGKTKGGLIRVCFDSFETKEEAIISLDELRSEKKSAWLLSL